jgi:hypothetical protein
MTEAIRLKVNSNLDHVEYGFCIICMKGRVLMCSSDMYSKVFLSFCLIVVFPCMLTIIQLLFQQNAHVFYY